MDNPSTHLNLDPIHRTQDPLRLARDSPRSIASHQNDPLSPLPTSLQFPQAAEPESGDPATPLAVAGLGRWIIAALVAGRDLRTFLLLLSTLPLCKFLAALWLGEACLRASSLCWGALPLRHPF